MGYERAVHLCEAMSTIWDARQWTDLKIQLFSKSIAHLDYHLASEAIRQLMRTTKWQPTPAEVCEAHDLLGKKILAQHHRVIEQREQQQLEERGPDGKLLALKPVREIVAKLTERLKMHPARGMFRDPAEETAPTQTAEQLDARRRELRAQAQRLARG